MEFIQVADKPVFHHPKMGELKVNPFSRCISAEIEVAGLSKYDRSHSDRELNNIVLEFRKYCERWGTNIVRDGSLPSTGFEINTAPAGGDLFIKQIKEVCSLIEKYEGYADRSCGLHIHFEARDLNYTKMVKYIKLWCKLEDTMYNLVHSSRKQSTYCTPIKAQFARILAMEKVSSFDISRFIGDVYQSPDRIASIDRNRTSRRPGSRYRSINLHSWFYRGTIENRMHQGTVMADKIIYWALLNVAILEAAINASDRDIDAIAENDGLAFLAAICLDPQMKEWVIDRYKLFQRDPVTNEKIWNSTSSRIVENTEV